MPQEADGVVYLYFGSAKMREKHYLAYLLLPLGLACQTSVQGAGLWLYERATPDMGTASAGRAATADNAAIAGDNPAGMTRLHRSELQAGIQPLYVDAKFDTEIAAHSGGDGGNAGGWVPAAGIHYVHSLSPDLKLGLAAGSNLGLGLDYGNSWAGRYYVTEGELLTFSINPSIGYRINDRFSVGGGVSLVYGELTQKVAINNPGPGVPDGQLRMEDDDIGYAFNLGALWEPAESTRFGLTYRSQVDLEYEDLASLKGLGVVLGGIFSGEQKIDLEMNLPQAVMLSAYHDIDDKLAIVANLGWQDWSEFGKSDIVIKDSSGSTKLTSDRDFDDTWHAAIGVRYRLSPPWMVMAGFAYDSSPVDDDDRTPDMPMDRQLRYAFGVQYEYSRDLTISAAYELLDAGDAAIDQNRGPLAGEFKGDFDTNQIHFFNINASWRF